MSFIKSIAKEIKSIKSMIDIPELKNERERIKKRIEESRIVHEKQQKIVQNRERIRQVFRDFEDIVSLSFEEGEQESAQNVINTLLTRVEESEKLSASVEGDISRLEQELKKVNDKLSAARGAVR